MEESTATVAVENSTEKQFYDVWRDRHWAGMTQGHTPQEARQMLEDSWGKAAADKCIITPFMGCGTSHATFEALVGKNYGKST